MATAWEEQRVSALNGVCACECTLYVCTYVHMYVVMNVLCTSTHIYIYICIYVGMGRVAQSV